MCDTLPQATNDPEIQKYLDDSRAELEPYGFPTIEKASGYIQALFGQDSVTVLHTPPVPQLVEYIGSREESDRLWKKIPAVQAALKKRFEELKREEAQK